MASAASLSTCRWIELSSELDGGAAEHQRRRGPLIMGALLRKRLRERQVAAAPLLDYDGLGLGVPG